MTEAAATTSQAEARSGGLAAALGSIATIASNTLREAIRSKVLYIFLVFAVIMIGAGILVSTLSYVERPRIMQDVGFAAIRLFGVAIAVFVGIGLVHKEVERRTIYTILSKPISRSVFLLGKYFGLVATVWLITFVMALAFVVVSYATEATVTLAHYAAFALSAMELCLITAIALFFSSFTTPMFASLFSVGIYLAGHLSRDLRDLGAASDSQAFKTFGAWAHRILPDLEGFNLTTQAVHGMSVTFEEFWYPIFYAIGYATVILLAAMLTFEKRDFR